jgi:hypothetical protein
LLKYESNLSYGLKFEKNEKHVFGIEQDSGIFLYDNNVRGREGNCRSYDGWKGVAAEVVAAMVKKMERSNVAF